MKRMLWAAVVLGVTACSSSKEGWVVAVQIRGPEAGFAGSQVVMRAKVEKTAPPPGGVGPGLLGTEVSFGTCDHARFLSAPIEIEIRQGDVTVAAATLDRVACRLASTAGYLERNFLYLEDTGNLLATIDGSDPRVYASCQNVGQPLECQNDEL